MNEERRDSRGRRLVPLQAYIEIGVNPHSRKMMVRPIECYEIIEDEEKKDEHQEPRP
jgi:hypothetical protein